MWQQLEAGTGQYQGSAKKALHSAEMLALTLTLTLTLTLILILTLTLTLTPIRSVQSTDSCSQ